MTKDTLKSQRLMFTTCLNCNGYFTVQYNNFFSGYCYHCKVLMGFKKM